jgi:hypothetical protein
VKLTRQERRAREATYPKCRCGATLGLERVAANIPQCRGCLPDEELRRRSDMADLRVQAVRATTLEDLREVVLEILRRME